MKWMLRIIHVYILWYPVKLNALNLTAEIYLITRFTKSSIKICLDFHLKKKQLKKINVHTVPTQSERNHRIKLLQISHNFNIVLVVFMNKMEAYGSSTVCVFTLANTCTYFFHFLFISFVFPFSLSLKWINIQNAYDWREEKESTKKYSIGKIIIKKKNKKNFICTHNDI